MKLSRLTSCFRVLLLVLFLSISALPQVVASDDARLVRRFVTGGSSVHSMSEYGYTVAKAMNADLKLNLVIRICSTETMLIAVGTSTVDPISLTWFFMNAKTIPRISIDRILVEVSPDCVDTGANSTPTELWLVRKAETPRTNQICACRLRATEYGSRKDAEGNVVVGTQKYRRAFDRLYNDVDLGFQDVGMVIGYRNIGSDNSVKRQLHSLENYSKQRKLELEKLFFGILEWNREDSVGEIQNVVVKAIRIADDCAKEGELPKTIFVD